jgi:hypothetical protein
MQLEEVKWEKPDLQTQLDAAQYEFDRATNPEEYNRTYTILTDLETRMNDLNEKENRANQAIDDADVEGLQEEYGNARTAREEKAQFIRDEANIEIEDFNPENGPPVLPDDAADGEGSTTGSESGEAAGGSETTGNEGEGSGTTGTEGEGSGTTGTEGEGSGTTGNEGEASTTTPTNP